MNASQIQPGLRQAARAMSFRIAELEQEIVTQSRLGNQQEALYAAHTAAYLRQLLVELIGPTWHAVVASDWPVAVSRT